MSAVITLLTCGVCGIGFCGRSDAIYCSSACRQKARRVAVVEPVRARRPALVKPDVAATIQRARVKQRRARELRRAADETMRRAHASQQAFAAG